jgi:hypothetical protein
MKNLTKTILAVLAAGVVTSVLSTQQAQAAKINGTIDFAGATQFDSKSLANATRVVKWRDVNGNLGFFQCGRRDRELLKHRIGY